MRRVATPPPCTIDDAYAQKMKDYTTAPDFTSPLVDGLRSSPSSAESQYNP
jgi:hypothetical protein